MAMNDEETLALIAGGHSFGKSHGAHPGKDCVGPEPAAAPLEEQGFGWSNKCGKGNAEDTSTSGLEGAWTKTPAQWSHDYLTHLFQYDWKQVKSPGGGTVWIPTDEAAAKLVPDAHVAGKTEAPMMLTTDLSMREDPSYRAIAERFLKDPAAFEKAFARAWFKLTHRDMGPQWRYLGADVPEQTFLWQDPLPQRDYELINAEQQARFKQMILDSALTVPELVRTAWASAASFRATDMRGGTNGARLRLAPQKEWAVNSPKELKRVLTTLESLQTKFVSTLPEGQSISLADTIVLAGAAAIEKAAADAGYSVTVPFTPGRVDASQAQTSQASFHHLKLQDDAFRNYYTEDSLRTPVNALVNRASLLDLTVPEMTVLLGGLRSLNANTDGASHGVLTDNPGQLSPDFFVNLLDMSTRWSPAEKTPGLYEGRDRDTDALKWTATPVDLIFGSNSELRAVAEVYASDDAHEQFTQDFVKAWVKVMNLDRLH